MVDGSEIAGDKSVDGFVSAHVTERTNVPIQSSLPVNRILIVIA